MALTRPLPATCTLVARRQANIVERDEVDHTIAERNVLAKIRHPFIINLKFSFQTTDKLYLVLSFVNGGEVCERTHRAPPPGCDKRLFSRGRRARS